MPSDALNLLHIKQTLDGLSADAEQGRYPSNILKDFKLSVDQLRLTLWAVISIDTQAKAAPHGVAFDLGGKLAEFRIKRLLQMLAALKEDFQKGSIPPSHPDLLALSSTLQDILENIGTLAGKRG